MGNVIDMLAWARSRLQEPAARPVAMAMPAPPPPAPRSADEALTILQKTGLDPADYHAAAQVFEAATGETILAAPSMPSDPFAHHAAITGAARPDDVYRATTANATPTNPAVKDALEGIGRNTAIQRIKDGLKRRSGKAWSVTGGKGTAWGWIRIGVTDRQANERPTWRQDLGDLLGLGRPVYPGGESVPASTDYYIQYVDLAEGRPPRVLGTPYWD